MDFGPYQLTGTSVDLKVDRARQHLAQLLDEIERFQDSRPYRTREERREWAGNYYRVVEAFDPKPPPTAISVLFGDFVHNLRASLDHLVGVMRPDGASKTSAFPIYQRRPDFLSLSRRKLGGLPPECKRVVERMQPYDKRYGRPSLERARWSQLAMLETLWSVEKHRSLVLATALIAPYYAASNRTEPTGIGHSGSLGQRASWWFPLDGDDSGDEAHFEVRVTPQKPRGFADDWPAIDDWELDSIAEGLYSRVAMDAIPYVWSVFQTHRAPGSPAGLPSVSAVPSRDGPGRGH